MSLPGSASLAQRSYAKGAIFLAVSLLVACVNRLPPAATPEPIVPSIDTAAPLEQNQGRLVIDVVQGQAAVQRVHMQAEQVDDGQGRVRYRFFELPELLCSVSPCVVDLPLGNVLLGFPVAGNSSAMEIELVHIGQEPTVYRRSLSEYDGETGTTRVLGIIGTALGASSMVTGLVLLPIGLKDESSGLTTAGGATLGIGTALLALGIWAIKSDSPSFRPGSSLHFPLQSP